MNAVGLITEYNPMHTGHLHHLAQAKNITNADCVIAVMSGNYVQRGEPAIIDKHSRSKAAVDSGINLVVELPAMYALSSAEGFAQGAVMTLAAIGADSVVFGSECGDINKLNNIASVILNETPEFKTNLANALASGLSYPAARQAAVKTALTASADNSDLSNISDILSSPNNILGIEYIKSIQKLHSGIKPYTIAREGTGYNESEISGLPSASAIRNILKTAYKDVNNFSNKDNSNSEFNKNSNHHNPLKKASAYLAPAMYNCFENAVSDGFIPIQSDDFTFLFNSKMNYIIYKCKGDKNRIINELAAYTDINKDLASRMYNKFNGCEPLSVYCMNVKSKQYTYSRISRAIMHIILDMTDERYKAYAARLPYIRILGFDCVGAKYLSSIRKECSTPLITKTGDYKDLLLDDIHCSHIYNEAVYNKCGYRIKDEYRCGVYIKK